MARKYRLLKKLLNDRNLGLKKIMILFVMLIAIIIGVICSAVSNLQVMREQLQQNIEDVAIQKGVILSEKISVQYRLLNSLTEELKGLTTDNVNEKLSHFERFLERFYLKRFALCFPDGMSYQTDVEGAVDLSFREFYQRGMEGKCTITGVLTDALSADHGMINIMTIPVYDESGAVTCVFGVAYDTEKFNEALAIESFDGKGYTCVVNESGEIMAVSADSVWEISTNIFDKLAEDSRNEQNAGHLRSLLDQGEDGEGVMYLPGKSYYYSVPVMLMDGDIIWHVLTIVPSSVLTERVVPIQRTQYRMIFLVGICVLAGVWLIIYMIQEQSRNMMRFAYEDSVTKGSNYAKFCTDMQSLHHKKGYLVAMDIANFSNIAIVAGKDAGDTMIKETWDIIYRMLGEEELACHVRDEMFLLYLYAKTEESLVQRLKYISEKVAKKAKDFQVFGIHAEYGIYQMDETERVVDAYNKAYMAKQNALFSEEIEYAFYSEASRVRMQNEKYLEERFPAAVENREFEAWYQPKFGTADRALVGSEALVRWRKADGSMISPGEFIPLFEKNGMIVQLDEYMFRAVCEQQRKWRDEGKTLYPVSVNVSRASLCRSDIVERYHRIMQQNEVRPEDIQIEVTERLIKGKDDIFKIINGFRDLGIKILMDDFGTGYSSLATLSKQCFDIIKLDKSLIDHIGTKDGETLLYHVIRMGQKMELRITAEGVETEEQFRFLKQVGCDDIQGYYFSKPLPEKEFGIKL